MSEQVDREWSRATLERVASQIAALRRARGWSAQDLANRIDELGYDLPRGAIAKIESGRRGVDVPEFLILAKALEVPPFALIVDLPSGDRVWGFPRDRDEHPWALVSWWRGDAPEFDPANLSSMPVRAHVLALHRWMDFDRHWQRCLLFSQGWRESVRQLEEVRADAAGALASEPSSAARNEWIAARERWVALERSHLDDAMADLFSGFRSEVVSLGLQGVAASMGTLDGARPPLLSAPDPAAEALSHEGRPDGDD